MGRVATEQIFSDIRKGSVTEDSLTEMLERHVERIDTDMAMEYQMQQGKGNNVIAYLVPKKMGKQWLSVTVVGEIPIQTAMKLTEHLKTADDLAVAGK